jgi:hypothetical protein
MSELPDDISVGKNDSTVVEEVTMQMMFSKISEVLEMNDLLHSEMTEIKKTLKAIVEVAKAATEDKKPEFKEDTNNSMYG